MVKGQLGRDSKPNQVSERRLEKPQFPVKLSPMPWDPAAMRLCRNFEHVALKMTAKDCSTRTIWKTSIES